MAAMRRARTDEVSPFKLNAGAVHEIRRCQQVPVELGQNLIERPVHPDNERIPPRRAPSDVNRLAWRTPVVAVVDLGHGLHTVISSDETTSSGTSNQPKDPRYGTKRTGTGSSMQKPNGPKNHGLSDVVTTPIIVAIPTMPPS